MERNCDNCHNLYKAKRATSKFCSDKCRMKYLRAHPKQKDEVTKFQMQTLYNEVVAAFQKIEGLIEGKLQTVTLSNPKQFDKGAPMERNDANMQSESKRFGNWLDEGMQPKMSVQDEYFSAFDACQEQYEVEQLAAKLKNDKRLEGWQKTPLFNYGKKRYEKL